jgi:hypothetical protein
LPITVLAVVIGVEIVAGFGFHSCWEKQRR